MRRYGLMTVIVGMLAGCQLVGRSLSASSKVGQVAGVKESFVGNLTIQEAVPVGLLVMVLALIFYAAFTQLLSHRREMRRIKAFEKAQARPPRRRWLGRRHG